MTVKEIVIRYLQFHGYDGLCNIDCGCGLDNLMPCGDISEACEVAMAGPDPDGDCEVYFSPVRSEVSE